MKIFASPFGDLLMLQGSNFESASRWIDAALDNRHTISAGVLLSAFEIAGYWARTAGRFEVALGYAEQAIGMSRNLEERQWLELAAASATQWLEGHSEATDATLDRLIAEADTPGLRASALLARANLEAPNHAWMLVEQALELSPIDSLGFYDECLAGQRIADTAADSGHYDVATQIAERTIDLARHLGWRRLEYQMAGQLAEVYGARGRLDEAATLVDEVVPVVRRILGPYGMGTQFLHRAAATFRLKGDLDKARLYAAESLRVAERRTLRWTGMGVIVETALIARDNGHLDKADEILGDALRRFEDLDHESFGPWFCALVNAAQASIELRRGNAARALENLTAVLAESRHIMHLETVGAVDLAAIAFAQQGRAELAAFLKGAVDRERDDCGLVVPPPDAPLRESAMQQAQSIYDDDWETALEQGRAMTLDEAIELARTEATPGHEPRPAITNADS
jgi:tetratricopeptide (TPR) repeat protein